MYNYYLHAFLMGMLQINTCSVKHYSGSSSHAHTPCLDRKHPTLGWLMVPHLRVAGCVAPPLGGRQNGQVPI